MVHGRVFPIGERSVVHMHELQHLPQGLVRDGAGSFIAISQNAAQECRIQTELAPAVSGSGEAVR